MTVIKLPPSLRYEDDVLTKAEAFIERIKTSRRRKLLDPLFFEHAGPVIVSYFKSLGWYKGAIKKEMKGYGII